MIKNLLLNNISQAYHMLENGSNYGSINELESFYSENINSILAMAYGTYEVYNVEGDVVIYIIYDKKDTLKMLKAIRIITTHILD